MAGDLPEPLDDFEPWLLRRVAHAGGAGEVPADLLMGLVGKLWAGKTITQDEGGARAVRDIAERLQIPSERVVRALKALECQPPVPRVLVIRRIAKAWPER